MLEDFFAQIGREKEIEMSKILHDFIVSNSHLFSKGVLEAAQKLMDEIDKLESK